MSLALRPTEMKCHCDRAAPMQQSAAMESIVFAAVAAAIGLCRILQDPSDTFIRTAGRVTAVVSAAHVLSIVTNGFSPEIPGISSSVIAHAKSECELRIATGCDSASHIASKVSQWHF